MNYYLAKSVVQTILVGLIVVIVVAAGGVVLYDPPLERGEQPISEELLLPVTHTTFTRRVYGLTPAASAAAISQIVYPATYANNKPHAVILARSDRWQEAYLAVNLIHHPIDAPLLFVDKNHIPEETQIELKRLDPEGFWLDNNVQVYAVGSIDASVIDEIEAMGYKVRRFTGNNIYELQERIDEYGAVIHADHEDEVIIVCEEYVDYALPATSWAAHESAALMFVKHNEVPLATKQALAERFNGAFIYVMGPESVINDTVVEELAGYGSVQRIPGETPEEVALRFAQYRDVGANYGYWVGTETREMGWGLSEPGHNFTIVNPRQWQQALPAAILSHRGKHSVMLYSGDDQLDSMTQKFIEALKPHPIDSRQSIFNYAWVIGDFDQISLDVQYKLEEMLQPRKTFVTTR